MLLLFLTSAMLFMVIQLAVENREPVQKEMPDGWKIIRPPHDVMALAIQGDTIWAGGKEGVIGLDRNSGLVITELTGVPPMTYVRALLVDRQGALWIGHPAGLTYYDGNTLQTFYKTYQKTGSGCH